MNNELITHLKALGNGTQEPLDDRLGICYDIRERFGRATKRLVCDLMDGWPKRSGDDSYPVPHAEKYADFAFIECSILWTNDQYGDDRRELCLFLASELEKIENVVTV
jgi:hypothetical protein